MTEYEKDIVIKHILSILLAEHPLPWTIEYDWCNQIVDSNRNIVHKCHREEDAKIIIRAAEEMQKELDRIDKENKALIDPIMAGEF